MRAALLVLVLLAVIAGRNAEHKASNYGLPLVASAQLIPDCPALKNPCAEIDCNRPDTKGIA